MADDKPVAPAVPADDVIIKMDPYVVSGERVLPPPESWRYVLVPALEVTRGKKVIVVPGFQILSNLAEQNTKVFVEELQLYQLAGAFLWPMIVQGLPREPIIVIIDRSKQAWSTPGESSSLVWEGEPITAASSQEQNIRYDSSAFSTGMQIVDGTPVIPEEFTTDPTPTTDTLPAATTRIQLDGAQPSLEPSPFKKSWRRPLPAGFTTVRSRDGVVAAQINADAPKAGADAPVEELLSADLSRRLAEFVIFNFRQQPPRWFQSGLGWLIATTSVSRTRITFADTGGMFSGEGAIPPLEPLLEKKGALTYEEDLLSAAFTHWGLYANDHKYADKLITLVEQQSRGNVTSQQFREIFGLSIRNVELEISNHSRTFTNYTSQQFDGKIPDLPEFTVREATQAEVARLQAESFISQGKSELALNGLRIAYWRGEREPAMLSILAELEEKQGSVERARKIIQGLQALPKPPVLTYITDARLRYREAIATKTVGEKLTAKETRVIMNPLGQAIQSGLVNEPLCAFFAEVVMHSCGKPHESVTAFLEQAAKKFPRNTLVRDALAFAKNASPAAPAAKETSAKANP